MRNGFFLSFPEGGRGFGGEGVVSVGTSPSSASEAEVVGRGASPVANLPPNTASAGAEAPAAVIRIQHRSATFRSLQAASILPRRDGS